MKLALAVSPVHAALKDFCRGLPPFFVYGFDKVCGRAKPPAPQLASVDAMKSHGPVRNFLQTTAESYPERL